MNFFLKSGIGFAIKKFAPVISKKVGQLLESPLKKIEELASNIDDWIEEKTGIDLFKDSWQEKWDDTVHLAVDHIEAIFTNQAAIRFVLNKVSRGDGSITMDDLKKYGGTQWEDFLKDLPTDFREMLSQEKMDLAVKFIQHHWKKFGNNKELPIEKVKASIKAMVAAKNGNHDRLKRLMPEPESMDSLWKRLTEESIERQNKLH